MDSRETKTITLASGKAVVLKTYLTAGEANAIQRVILSKINISQNVDGAGSKTVTNGEIGIDRNEELVKAVVVSIDGNTENIPARLLDLRSSEYKQILDEANKLVNGDF